MKAHPATVNWSVASATCIPLASTRVLALIVVTWPPCGHIATAPTWKRSPGMSGPPAAGYVGLPGAAHVMTRAASLTATVGPTSVIVAPWPLEM